MKPLGIPRSLSIASLNVLIFLTEIQYKGVTGIGNVYLDLNSKALRTLDALEWRLRK